MDRDARRGLSLLAPLRVGVNALPLGGGDTGGGTTYLTNLLRAMRDLRPVRSGAVRLVVLAHPAGWARLRLGGEGIEWVPVRGARSLPARLLAENVRLPWLCRRAGIDLFWGPFDTLPPALPCPGMVTVQNLIYFRPDLFDWKGASWSGRLRLAAQARYYRWRTPASVRRARLVIAVSAAVRDRLVAEGVAPSRIRVVHEGVTPEFFEAPEPEADPPEPFVLYVGALAPHKGLFPLLEAWKRLLEEPGETPRLCLAGEGHDYYERRLVARRDGLGLGDAVTFLGRVEDRDRLRSLYRRALCLVQPSECESFGLPVVEAMASGTPAVVARASLHEDVVDGDVLVVDGDAPGTIAGAVRKLMDDPDLRKELGARARERVRPLSWTAAGRGTLEAIVAAALKPTEDDGSR